MHSRERQKKIQELVDLIQSKLQEIKSARERDAIFEEMKRLYLELKDLDRQLTETLGQLDLSQK